MSVICLRCNKHIHLEGACSTSQWDEAGVSCVATGAPPQISMRNGNNNNNQQLVRKDHPKALTIPFWQVPEGERDPHWHEKKKKKKPLTDEQINLMVKRFNQWWRIFHQMEINFSFGRGDYEYITPSEAALARNNILNLRLQAMGLTDPITIMEGFAGCGADTITFISDIKPTPKQIIACDNDESKRAQVETNIGNFAEAYRNRYRVDNMPTVMYYPMDVDTMIRRNAPIGAIDLLYLDPPWELVQGEGEVGGSELVKWLAKHVFSQFSQLWKKNRPKLIIIKTRFDAKEMKRLNVDGYLFVDTLDFTPFHRQVHFHTLQSTECRTHHVWLPSQKYIDLHPAAARGNHLKGVGYGPTYQVGYYKDEDTRPYWYKVKDNQIQDGTVDDEDTQYEVISRKNTPHKVFTVHPDESAPNGRDSHMKRAHMEALAMGKGGGKKQAKNLIGKGAFGVLEEVEDA
jgi:hypothetical protein